MLNEGERMSNLRETLASGTFAVTAELSPPKGTNLDSLYEKADLLKGRVNAFNLTDSYTAKMAMVPLAAAKLLLDRGVESILQLTCRDRNRIALQADLLGASALGIGNIVCMGGDPPTVGDHPEAKPVFDFDAVALLAAVRALTEGHDIHDNPLRGTPEFFAGAVANPGADDLDFEISRVKLKIEAGAQFFQTQAVYDPADYERYAEATADMGVPMLPSIIMLKSADMARFLNEKVPGITVPEAIINDMEKATTAEDRSKASVEIAARTIRGLQGLSQGVHLIAAGWESRLPRVLEEAGL